jgi:very-short-patch-repair endonuclease
MGQLEEVLWQGGGFATAGQLGEAGATSRSLRALVDSGRVTRPRRGMYALRSAHPAGLRAVALGARLAGVSAASTYGLWGGWNEPLTVAVRRNASMVGGRKRGGWHPGARFDDTIGSFVVHWNDDPEDTRWCWRVSVERCTRQVLAWNDVETAAAVVDTALTTGHVDHAVLLRATERSASLYQLVKACRSGSGSGVESITRQRLERHGLVLDQQVAIEGVGVVDLMIRGSRVVIEVDGYEFHSSPQKFADDRRRDAEARARGFSPMRFTAVQVRDQWPWVERMVLAALAQSRA